MVLCPGCGFENPAGTKFCGQCATPLSPRCPQCEVENPPGFVFCGQCATPLTGQTPASNPSSPGAQPAPQDAYASGPVPEDVGPGRWAGARFHAVLPAAMVLLQREGRITYPTLKQIFGLDDAFLEALREELVFKQVARDDQGKGLVWEAMPTAAPSDGPIAASEPADSAPEAERRQLTVMFCDLADSTTLSQQLDPEDLREVIRAYQDTAVAVVQRFEGYAAQYLGDGLLIYFGWPQAHEDDAHRALHAGLGIVEAITTRLNPRLEQEKGVRLAVRIGIHTGPVVVGEMGGGGRHENLATGDTVNIAARLEGLAAANTAVISQVTAHLVQGAFALEDLGLQQLKGVAEPMGVFRVLGPLEIHQDEGQASIEVPFLVGRDEEMGLLLRRWEQSKERLGQVVLVSGEAGIGKSSLVEVLRAHVRDEGLSRITFRCSSYHRNSTLYPVIAHVERLLDFQREDAPETKLDKLEQGLQPYSLSLEDVLPLFATLLSVPLDGRYPAPTLTPQQQKQQTLDALVAWMLEEAEQQSLLVVWEDLHWADPSTLEMLGLVLDQTPTVPMLSVLTFRPEFDPPWPTRSHMTPITLNRLERPQVEALITHLTEGKALPAEVVGHIVAKTDGVPLYVEELTKMLLESDLLREETDHYTLTGPLSTVTIPATLQDSLMARLDRLQAAKEVAQLGAVLGREFRYEMLQALSKLEETPLQVELARLVAAELLYQRGRPPRSTYMFKHALIQDAAYASLLKRTRQQMHQRVAECLVATFTEISVIQPELVAHHYTEAGCYEQAVTYWQHAVELARQRQAHAEAAEHCSRGIELLSHLPQTPDHIQQEIMLQAALGASLIVVKGFAATEVEQAYERARRRCQQLGDTPQLFPVLVGLCVLYTVRREHRTGQELAEQVLHLAERSKDPKRLTVAHYLVGAASFMLGDFQRTQTHTAQGIRDYDAQHHAALVSLINQDPGVGCYLYLALALQMLGYAEQAAEHMQAALRLAQELNHPFTFGYALVVALRFYQMRQEWSLVIAHAETLLAHADEHGFGQFPASSLTWRGYALAKQGYVEEGIALTYQRNAREHLFTVGTSRTGYQRMLLCEMDAMVGQGEQALQELEDILVRCDQSGGDFSYAECHRIKGELLLQLDADHQAQAEACFHQALDIARRQAAKWWELRAAVSLSRLWHDQGKRQEAYDLLAPVYHWFTEGFDTADLQEARTLLDELA
jgi:class 3 adenylate cyclase/predicted ATPase